MKTGKFNSKNVRAKKEAFLKKLSTKEMEIENASLFMRDDIVDNLRDDLEKLRKSAFPTEEPMLDPMSGDVDNPVPQSPEDIRRTLFNALANSFELSVDDKGVPKFNVEVDEQEHTIMIYPASDLHAGEYEDFDIQAYYNSMLGYIDSINIGISDEEKESLKINIKDLLDDYYNSLDSVI